jgi:hypothetical protein
MRVLLLVLVNFVVVSCAAKRAGMAVAAGLLSRLQRAPSFRLSARCQALGTRPLLQGLLRFGLWPLVCPPLWSACILSHIFGGFG